MLASQHVCHLGLSQHTVTGTSGVHINQETANPTGVIEKDKSYLSSDSIPELRIIVIFAHQHPSGINKQPPSPKQNRKPQISVRRFAIDTRVPGKSSLTAYTPKSQTRLSSTRHSLLSRDSCSSCDRKRTPASSGSVLQAVSSPRASVSYGRRGCWFRAWTFRVR
jgi:hypothetical protein